MNENIKNKIKEYYKQKFIKNKIKQDNIKKYYKNKTKLEIQITKYRKLMKDDSFYKILNSLATRTNSFFKLKNIKIDKTHYQILGCNKKELIEYLESHFQEKMSFENFGEWEVDHIIPVSSINPNNEESILTILNYKNLQPLWKTDNRKKYNRVEIE